MASSAGYNKMFPVSWTELHRDARALAWRLADLGPFKGLVAITRGGLVPAAIIARELNLRLIDTVCCSTYDRMERGAKVEMLKGTLAEQDKGKGWLIVDDLVDTGVTARAVRAMLPEAHFATVYAKPAGRPTVDSYITEVSQDTWILFPWDQEAVMAKTILELKASASNALLHPLRARQHRLAHAGRTARPDARSAPGAGAGAGDVAQLPRPDHRRGQYARAAPKPDLIPLSDGAGEIVAVGPGVSRVKVGDRVAGCFMQKWIGGAIDEAAQASAMGGAIDGMLTELAVLEEDGAVLLPQHLSFEEGATLPCAAVTAWNALVEIGQLKAGDTVLVQGSGGVSIFALQFARMFGARVIATSSSAAKAERLKQMGAEAVIDYKATPDWDKEALKLTGGRGADLVVEVGGAGTLPRSFLAARLGGRIAVIGLLSGMAQVDPMPILRRNLRVQGLYVGSKQMFEAMNRAIEAGGLKPVIDKVFPFAEAKEAYRHLKSQKHFGKIVIAH